MSTEAIILMLISMAILWGGLAVAIVRLRGHDLPEEPVRRDR